MLQVTLRFYADLNAFLPRARRQVAFPLRLTKPASVKDVIEARGVPHTEVELILVNGQPVDFAYLVRDGDRIGVYPPFTSLDISPLLRVQPAPLPEPRFVLDGHLGTLARSLRLLGFDALYRNDSDDDTLARLSSDEGRILLTRDRGLLKRRVVTRGYHVWETDPARQVGEVLRRFDLHGAVAPFTRCLRCNGVLVDVAKDVIADRLPPYTRASYDAFRACQACGRVYWQGAHDRGLQQLIHRLLAP
jgi:uncharacterized protein